MRNRLRTASGDRSLADVAASAGFRRIDHVRLILGRGPTVAEATGIVHRYPCTVPVSLATAGRLISAGAHMRVTDCATTGRA